MTTYYASTYLYQYDQEFQSDWDLTAMKNAPTEEETIAHSAEILEENWENPCNLRRI